METDLVQEWLEIPFRHESGLPSHGPVERKGGQVGAQVAS